MKKFVSSLAGAVMAIGAISTVFTSPSNAAELQDILSAGKVRIGVPVDVPPFGFVDANNQPVGLDVDVANLIGEALGVEVELQQITGANRIPYLVTNRQSVAVARGTTQDIELTAAAPNANIQRFDDDATAAAAFLSGQADLLATANVVARNLMENNDKVELNAKFILRLAPTHIGIQQGNPELLRWLDTFVFYHKTTGVLSDITEKWLGQPLPDNLPTF